MNEKIKIGFTGTQEGMTDIQKKKFSGFINKIDISEFHHGDCIGADEDAHDMINLSSASQSFTIIHPPIKKDKRANCEIISGTILEPKEYLERNHDIVDSCDLLIACPKEKTEQLRSGTWATVRYAKKQKKNILIIYPDGIIKTYHKEDIK